MMRIRSWVQRGFWIPPGENKEHAIRLKAGLKCMPEGFIAEICGICDGHGEYQQTYNNGCGMGFSRMYGECNYCDGVGLRQNGRPAPASVVCQVLTAAEQAEADRAALCAQWPGEEEEAVDFLVDQGYTLTRYWTWQKPSSHTPTERELSAIQYLMEKHDFGWIEGESRE